MNPIHSLHGMDLLDPTDRYWRFSPWYLQRLLKGNEWTSQSIKVSRINWGNLHKKGNWSLLLKCLTLWNWWRINSFSWGASIRSKNSSEKVSKVLSLKMEDNWRIRSFGKRVNKHVAPNWPNLNSSRFSWWNSCAFIPKWHARNRFRLGAQSFMPWRKPVTWDQSDSIFTFRNDLVENNSLQLRKGTTNLPFNRIHNMESQISQSWTRSCQICQNFTHYQSKSIESCWTLLNLITSMLLEARLPPKLQLRIRSILSDEWLTNRGSVLGWRMDSLWMKSFHFLPSKVLLN